jgi:hypothetical protein
LFFPVLILLWSSHLLSVLWDWDLSAGVEMMITKEAVRQSSTMIDVVRLFEISLLSSLEIIRQY